MDSVFYKEYGAIYFDRFEARMSEKVIEFAHLAGRHNLPSVFLDSMRENACVYLLSWNES
jgi:hypothetical protein